MDHPFWSIPAADLLQQLHTSRAGLTDAEAKKRLAAHGHNLIKPKKRTNIVSLLAAQFTNPLILILLGAVALSFGLGDVTNAFIILSIIFLSGILGFWQEYGAASAVEKLLLIVQVKATVLRDKAEVDVPIEVLVPGDMLVLKAGDIIPADCLCLEARDLFIDEASLTGETFPVEKSPAVLDQATALAKRTNTLWMGTHVISGSATAVIVRTGKNTEFGNISQKLSLRPPLTEFEIGIKRFGYFLMEITLLLVLAIFMLNVLLNRPVLDSFLFSLALAVGLTPQLLPAIISINLSYGAKHMAQEKVIVKRLVAIENFGSMNILCSDKTGTLTTGQVQIKSVLDVEGNENQKAYTYAYLNAFFETGFANPIDQALRQSKKPDITGYQKLDEIPYDFIRKRLSILVKKDTTNLLISKGALSDILKVCSSVESPSGTVTDIQTFQKKIEQEQETLSHQGFRILGVAYKDTGNKTVINMHDETAMTFLGYLVLFDPIKENMASTILTLRQLGVSLKIISGDNHLVAREVGKQIGLDHAQLVTGDELRKMSDEALLHRASKIDIFAEVEPNQKERIIIALKKAGNVVGYMGDGINDATALHAADVGISVQSAVDVAKDAADIVLLEKDLAVLAHGIKEGRKTFANTIKYVFMATSANFGNMFSMAGASLFLPFLPLLPKQVLLMNFMTDFPEMTIATDNVDAELVNQPRRFNIKFIRKFMLTFGIISSVFDYLTFGILLFFLHATPAQFRTGWFLESVISAALIVLLVRTHKPFLQSRPGKYLLGTTLLIVGLTLILPVTPLAGLFNFQAIPFPIVLLLMGIILMYIITVEKAKKIFYRKVTY